MYGPHTNKLDKLDERDKFLETHNLQRWKYEQTENFGTPLTSKEVESVIKKKNLSTKKSPDGFTDEFYQTFKELTTPILLKLFQTTEKEKTLSKSFCETRITHPYQSHTKTLQEKKTTDQYP